MGRKVQGKELSEVEGSARFLSVLARSKGYFSSKKGFPGISLLGVFFVSLFSFGTLGCGPDTNLNGLLFDSAGDSLTVLLEDARIKYDSGNFAEAESLSAKAMAKYPQSQEAAILNSYATLGSVGLGLFDVIKVLVLDEDSAKDEEDAKIKECASLTNVIATDGTAGKLDCLLGLDISNPDIFDGLSVDDFRASNEVLKAVTKVVGNLCGFFPAPTDANASGARLFDYTRHSCTEKKVKNTNNARAVFVWALAHLFEATLLNIQSLYLEAQADALDGSTDVESLTSKLSELGTVIGGSSGEGSFLTEALNDLTTVTNSIALIAGTKTEITNPIREATERIQNVSTRAFGGGTSTDSSDEGEVLTKVNEAISEKVAADASELQSLEGEEKTDLCEGYEGLGGEQSELEALVGGSFSCD